MSEPAESAKSTSRSRNKPSDLRQLIVTLSRQHGDVIKVEELEKSGKRHELMDEEFAALAGDDEAADFFPALEHAYAAGFADADDEGFEFGPDEEEEGSDIEQFLLHGVAAHPFLRHEVRKVILSRLVRRQLRRGHKRRGGKIRGTAHDLEADEQRLAPREEKKAKVKD